MGDLTKNFSRWEFACRCGCGFDTVDYELLLVLQDIADNFDSSVYISGPNRCLEHNNLTRGAVSNSKHLVAKAADIKVKGVAPVDVYNYIDVKYPDKYGLKLYHNRVHFDVRENKWRNKGIK